MPAYEYRCPKCAVHITDHRPITETREPENCPECESTLVRLYNFGSVTFTGSGFYSTDK
jgi:putative FmdB family regulatory protein